MKMVTKQIKFTSILLLFLCVLELNAQGFLDQLGRQFGFDLGGLGNPRQQQGGGFGRSVSMPNLQNQGLGSNVANLLGQMGIDSRITSQVGATIDGIASQFFAPSPDSPIPPHVQRRIMRFCSRHPNHRRCSEHPEWNVSPQNLPPPPSVGGVVDLNEMFPNFIPFKVPPIPVARPDQLRNFLANVPDFLRNVIPAPILGQLSDVNRQTLENTCSGSRQCREQKPEWLNRRATLAEQEAIVHRVINPGRKQEELDNDIETRLARTHQVKKALLRNAGLSNKVEPINDGIFQKDILLTEKQSNSILVEIDANKGGRRAKRSAVFLEENPAERWPIGQPIPYFIDESLDASEKSAIDAAVQEIQSKSCIRFTKVAQRPQKFYLYYIKIANPTFCGLSYIGRIDPANPIYLSFACGNPTGIAIHETLHALGLNHEQLRSDRDDFVKILYENVNPQNYDFFSIADGKLFTSYGVKYDYGSIMHYSSTTAAQTINKITMSAKIDPVKNNALMGQRYGLSASDQLLLKRLYCSSPGCDDKNVYCGAWATRNLCNTEAQKGWMVQNCRKSCGFCT